MKDPEYVLIGKIGEPNQIIRPDTTVFICITCGSVIADKSSHNAWHREQAPGGGR